MNGRILMEDIQNGYRMTPPEYSPNVFGQIMKYCWKKDPKKRPTFSQLAEMIEKYIESLVSIDFLNMNFSSENGAVKELLDPTRTNRLDIMNILNETSRSRDVNQDV
jgi:hypothetical protein